MHFDHVIWHHNAFCNIFVWKMSPCVCCDIIRLIWNVIFWNIAPKHWIYRDRGYCNSFYFYLWLYNYWEYVIECVFAVEGHIINTLCLCISSVWEQYSKILHNMHFDHVIWHHNAFCNIFVWKMSPCVCCMIGFFSILQFFPGKFW
jgi:hypothetical protein